MNEELNTIPHILINLNTQAIFFAQNTLYIRSVNEKVL